MTPPRASSGRGPGSSRLGPVRVAAVVYAVPIACIVLVTLVTAPTLGWARSGASLPYPSNHVWAAAVRFLRVDRGLPVREKDEAAGYVLFDYLEAGKSYHGALELVPIVDDDGRGSTQISVSIPGLPKRYEAALIEQLAAKVREERGPPAQAPRRQPRADRDGDHERNPGKAAPPPAPTPTDAGALPRAPTLPGP